MQKEIEIKILDINTKKINNKLKKLGAQKTFYGLLVVDWFRPKGVGEGEDPWFLRIRGKEGHSPEVTWKSLSTSEKVNHIANEINVQVNNSVDMKNLLIAIDLELYAHQEKYRTSWVLDSCAFDIDEYPKTPAFIEIEAKSSKEIEAAIKLLGLQKNKRWSEGERILIQKVYKNDWYDMRF